MIQSPHFVGRPAELAHLQSVLSQAVVGQGRAIFVTGEAGFGKSALIQAFAQHAQQQFPALLVAGGNCNAYTGFGDPYLPLREILALLTGDTETQQQAGALTSVHTARLQTLAPQAIHALIEVAPDLLGTLIAPTALLTRSAKLIDEPSVKAQLQRLAAQKAREQTHSSAARPQTAIFEQVTKLLQRLAATAPLLLLVDDLQWADMGTISLLFHLARHLSHSPILLVGAFRPSEVLAGNQSNGQRWATGAQHPLAALYYEMQRQWGAIEVALEAADGQSFVAALVDRQPNQLDAAFRTRLHQYTHGNALFTVELLAGMQARGDLVRAADGRWLASATLDWETLPPRIEGVIAQRVARLPVDLRETLALASVMGENFQAEVLAGVQGVDRRQMVRWLSSELDRQHGLVTLQGIEPRGEQAITRYRFRHILFQKYLYQRLDAAERSHLHSAVDAALEAIYQNQPEASEAVAGELARHYEQAGSWLKAADWLLVSANRAYRLSALDEAIEACAKGVALLQNSTDTPARYKLESGLLVMQAVASTPKYGMAASAVEQAYTRAAELAEKIGDIAELFKALRGLALCYRFSRRYDEAMRIARSMLHWAEIHEDAAMQMEAHGALGSCFHYLAKFDEGNQHLALSVKCLETLVQEKLVQLHHYESIVNYLCIQSQLLWKIGFPDQALNTIHKTYELACQCGHPNSIAFALHFTIYAHFVRRDPMKAKEALLEMAELTTKYGLDNWQAMPLLFQGYVYSELGLFDKALAILKPIFGQFGIYTMAWGPAIWVLTCMKIGDYQTGLVVIDKILQYNEYTWLAEVNRLRGKLLLLQAGEAESTAAIEAERSFQKALQVARSQNAKSWELRAAISLAKLWRQQGKVKEARDLLAPIYQWFTEGLDSYDLQKAKSLLDLLMTECRQD